ncbi:glycoside hydrolase family 97 catalytic domain-containing protein [Candidatus Soleaferrea massiliensis]|uniref:glycoside hydrolase family 97 catalytic domain-containing protein n=1 Tax=Candidatus Soleaferrea massiliensis TaxID=1470354 RepID=UPI00059022F1|nr:glycoside hydrolase family 97 catalytic domain-containing protein [Candidatus Soleaferrea massiliensis]
MKHRFRKLLSSILAAAMVASVVPAINLASAQDTAANDVAVWLEDVDWVSATTGWKEIGLGKPCNASKMIFQDYENNKEVSFDHGVGAHANTEIVYDISSGKYTAFDSYVGLDKYSDASNSGKGSVYFEVYLDGELAYKSPKFVRDSQFEHINIDLTGKKELKLVGNDAGDGNNSDWIDWADAKLIVDEKYHKDLNELSMKASENWIQIGDSVNLDTVAKHLDGTAVDFSAEGSLVYTSSDETVASVSEDGVITGVADGSATITATATLGDITKTASMDILVGKGGYVELWTIDSPSANNSIIFLLDEAGAVSYMARNEGNNAINISPTGLNTSLGDFTTGLNFVSKEEKVIDETYEMYSGKRSVERNHANETTLKFEKDGVQYNIIARAYDDGVAYRYQIIGEDGQELIINSENTGFDVPADSETYAQPYTSDNYERTYDKGTITGLNGNFGMSFLYKTPDDVWVMLAEAAHTPQYCGMMLKATGSTMLQGVWARTQGSAKPTTTAPFLSPWRVAYLGTQADIAESQILENLSDPCQIEDTSWIEAGVSTWTWLNGAGQNYNAYKQYVDLTAEMGWTYMLMDEGWNIGGRPNIIFPDWLDDLVSYADSKGVKLLAWLHVSAINTEEKAQDVLSRLSAAGIAGTKMDFFDSESQDQMIMYDYLTRICAEQHLVVNYHGANLPTGERRTWPHVLTREGIRGDEYNNSFSNQTTVLNLTRNAVGPMDYTPVYSGRGNLTLGHRLAMTVAFESGIPCLAGSASEYRNSPAYSFFRKLPAAWDETKLLESYAAQYTTMARQSGDKWYVGSMTVDARTSTLDLSFLDADTPYYAYIYTDGVDANNNKTLIEEERMVTSEDVLTFDVQANGGYAVKLSKTPPSYADEIILDKTAASIEKDGTVTIGYTLNPSDVDDTKVTWSSSNENVATVEAGVVTGVNPGTATITAATGPNGEVTATCEITVTRKPYELHKNWSIVREYKPGWWINSQNSMTIVAKKGDLVNNRTAARNITLTPVSGDFEATVKLDFKPFTDFQSAGLIVYAEDANFFSVLKRHHSYWNNECFSANNQVNGSTREMPVDDPRPDDIVYLKIVKQGSSLSGYYSHDEQNWTQIGETVTNAALNEKEIKIGMIAMIGDAEYGDCDATFMDLKVNGELVPFAYRNEGMSSDLVVEDGMIADAPKETTADAFKTMFNQDEGAVVIRDKDGNELAADALVGTGCKVEIVCDGVVTDSADVVIPGDVDGDGRQSVMDLVAVKQTILTASDLDAPNFKAADLDENGKLNIFDLLRIKLNILNGN